MLDDASPSLRDLRRRREHTEQGIREKLNQLILHHKKELVDTYITQQSGTFVLPILKRFQINREGIDEYHEQNRSIQTVFRQELPDGRSVLLHPDRIRISRPEDLADHSPVRLTFRYPWPVAGRY